MGSAYFAAKRFELAKQPLEKLKSLGTMTGADGDPLEMLARVYRELDQAEAEHETLKEIISLSSNALPALRRLIELAREEQDWDLVAEYADKINSINPLQSDGHLALAEAAEESNRPIDVLRSLGALRHMDPVDPAGLDYRMAVALTEVEQFELAKHHVLRALDEAPRYRDAHRLLLKLSRRSSQSQQADGTTEASEDQVETK